MSTTTSNDPLYHDVRPEYERTTRLFLLVTVLVCLVAMVCAVVKAQEEKKFYIIILSLIVSIIFTGCIYQFFKRRILLAEKLWFVNLIVVFLFVQAVVFIIFVFIKPYPAAPTTTTTMPTSPFSTTPFNTTNMTNITSTTVTSTTVSKRYSWQRQAILTRLYDQSEDS